MNSALFFPVLPGIAWEVHKEMEFSNELLEATSGKKTALQYWPSPRWNFTCDFNFLRDCRNSSAYTELAQLVGLFGLCAGNAGTFLYRDPNDYKVRGQLVGTGDGETTQFQLVRDFGGFLEPIENADPETINVYVAGAKLATSAWTLDAYGNVTLTSAPAEGAAVTADFEFYFLCRFLASKQDFNNWIWQVFKAQSVKFSSEFLP